MGVVSAGVVWCFLGGVGDVGAYLYLPLRDYGYESSFAFCSRTFCSATTAMNRVLASVAVLAAPRLRL